MNAYNNSITILHLKYGASKVEVRSAYLKLAHIHHPDKPSGNAKKFVEIKNAYDYLMANNAPFQQREAPKRSYNHETNEWGDIPPTTGRTYKREWGFDSSNMGFYGNFYSNVNSSMEKMNRIMVLQQEIQNLRAKLLQKEIELKKVMGYM